MGTSLFRAIGVDIAAELNGALNASFLPAVLTKRTHGARTPGANTAGRAVTETDYACKGIVDGYSHREIDGERIKAGDMEILLLGNSIAGGVTPEPDDDVTIEGVKYRITGPVRRDPAGATFTCNGRGRP